MTSSLPSSSRSSFSRCSHFVEVHFIFQVHAIVLGAYHSLDEQHQWRVESPFSFYWQISFSSLSFKLTLIASLDRTGLPWGLEHHWGHSCQCRSLFQRLEQGWDKSGHRPFCITGGGQPTWRPHCQDEVPEDVLRQADCCQWGSHSALHCSEGVRFRETVVVENYGPLPNDRLKIDLYDTVLYIWYYESISAVQMSQKS